MRKSDGAARVWVGLFGVALLLVVNDAAAAKGGKDTAAGTSAKKKILIGGFDGPKSGEARKALIKALKADGGYDVGETTAVKPGSGDKTFASSSGGATAVIIGSVKKSSLVLGVHNGADGALVQDIEIKGDTPAKLNKNVEDTAGLSLADAIAQTKPGAAAPIADTPSAATPATEQEESPTPAPPGDGPAAVTSSDAPPYPDGHTPLELDAGLRAVHRNFEYHDTPAQLFPGRGYPEPQTYKLGLGPALFVGGTVYPLAFGSRALISNFGITASYERNFGTRSVFNTLDATTMKLSEHRLTTQANQFFVGLKARIPVSVHEIGIVAGYGQQVFNLLGDELAPTVPDVHYKFLRVSAEGRFRLDAFSVGLHVGTRFVNDTGGLERYWFPGHVKTQNLEAGIFAGYSLMSSVDVIFGLDVTRYAFDFNPIPDGLKSTGPRTIAGGAVDSYTSGFFGVRYSLPSHQ